MRYEGFYDSCGEGRIHYIKWVPEGKTVGVLQIVHGMAEMASRYDEFASFLGGLGYLVVAEDHMGHGGSVSSCQGYFSGGWMAVVKDILHLTELTKQEYPELPYVFLGHSMGSFLLRTILCRCPELSIDGAILSGTGWQPRAGLPVMEKLCAAVCRKEGDTSPSPFLNELVFGSYNRKVEHRRTEYDWLTSDRKVVDAYLESKDCGFPITAGMFRDLMQGLQLVENPRELHNMRKDLPVLFAAGTMDPVGNYTKGVRQTISAFQKAGMQDVEYKFYPLCRHEILNEINRQEVFEDLSCWLQKKRF